MKRTAKGAATMRPSSIMQFMSKATGLVPRGVSAKSPGGPATGTGPTPAPAPEKSDLLKNYSSKDPVNLTLRNVLSKDPVNLTMRSDSLKNLSLKNLSPKDPVNPTPNLIQGNSCAMQSAPFSSSGPDTLVNGGADFFAAGKRPLAEMLDKSECSATPAKKPCPDTRATELRRKHETRLNEATRAYLADVQRLHREEIAAVRRNLEQTEAEHCAFFEGEPLEAPHLAAKRSGILFQKRRHLEKKLHQLEQWSPLAEAQETVRSYLLRHSTATEAECAAIVQDFVGRYCENSSPVHRCNTMLCPTCQIPMNIMHDDGFLLCVKCLATQVHTERTSFNGQSGGDDADIHLISNKRESNFRDFLHLLQGKKLNPALEAKMPLIAKSLGHLVPSWASFALCSSTVQSAIVENLTTLGLRKFSKYVVLIESRLRKIPVPAIPLQVENRLCTMFLIIVDPYERHKPASRKHFISYAYCAWQFCRIEKLPHHLPYFRLLKDEKKIMQQDHVFKLVCDELSWEFASPISHGYHCVKHTVS